MVKMMVTKIASCSSFVMGLVTVALFLSCARETGVALESIEVFDKDCHPKASQCDSTLIASFEPNQEFEILDEIALKEDVLYKIRLADGKVGYVLQGPKIRVRRR